jgi:spore germination cell wall hydrolase CwlJ-like protein
LLKTVERLSAMRFLEYIGLSTCAFFVAMTAGYLNNSNAAIGDPVKLNASELHCMAQNIYFEANNQSKTGMIAVAQVTMNRVRDSRFPDTVCEVVFEGPIRESWKTRKDPDLPDEDRIFYPVKNRCQFSWYCDGKADVIPFPENNISWRKAQDVALEVMAFDRYSGIVEGATHYHADYVNPDWNKTITLVTKIDNHIFYRWD